MIGKTVCHQAGHAERNPDSMPNGNLCIWSIGFDQSFQACFSKEVCVWLSARTDSLSVSAAVWDFEDEVLGCFNQ